jgi:hypothetical protein
VLSLSCLRRPLSLHETLEVAHADASAELAHLIPPHAVPAAHRGAMAVFLAGWHFLDELYALCYGSLAPCSTAPRQ